MTPPITLFVWLGERRIASLQVQHIPRIGERIAVIMPGGLCESYRVVEVTHVARHDSDEILNVEARVRPA